MEGVTVDNPGRLAGTSDASSRLLWQSEAVAEGTASLDGKRGASVNRDAARCPVREREPRISLSAGKPRPKKLEQPLFPRVERQTNAAVDPELLVDVVEVDFDGPLADVELL